MTESSFNYGFNSFFTADWLMIKYFHGEKYTHHCSGLERMAVVLITCDPGVQTVSYIILAGNCIVNKNSIFINYFNRTIANPFF